MGCHGGFSLDEVTRRSWYNPERVLSDLKSGMTFADIGCGDGFFTLLAAKIVGEKGKVYAVDIDPFAINKLKKRAQSLGQSNIIAKVGKAEEIVFCDSCVDFLLFSMDLHDLADPLMALKNAQSMLKPSGRLLDLDWKKTEMPFGPPLAIRFSEEYVKSLLEKANFSAMSIGQAGPYHYLIIAKP